MKKFNQYRRDGRAAMLTHPDAGRRGEDEETIGTDTIASILHSLVGTTTFDRRASDLVKARSLVERAFRTFEGDYEDLEDARARRGSR